MKFEPTFAEPKAPAAVPWGKPPPAPWKPPAPEARPPLPVKLPKTPPIDLTKTPKPNLAPNPPPGTALPKPGPGNFPKPKLDKAPTPTSPSPKLPNFRAIGRRLAWDIVNAGPTANGNLPDFDKPLPEPRPGPIKSNLPDLSTEPCVSPTNYGLPPKTRGSIAQIQLFYGTTPDGFPSTTSVYEPPSWKENYGLLHVIQLEGYNANAIHQGTNFLKYGVKSQATYTGPDQKVYKKYILWSQRYGTLPGKGEEWEGDYMFTEYEIRADYDRGADYYATYFPEGKVLQRGTGYTYYFLDAVGFCGEDDFPEPIENDDYDREEDEDEMACKWKPANDTNVESLEMIDCTVKHFKECRFIMGGEPDHFEEKVVKFPRGISASMIAMYNRQSEIQAQFCDLPLSPMVLPDWMPLKWGNVEKLVVLYAVEKNGKKGPAKYSITIPHWPKTKVQTQSYMFPSYTKGNWNLIMEHSDGSRVTLNADTKQSAEALMLNFRNLLDAPWRFSEIESAGLRRGKAVQENYVVATEVRFFKAGTDEIKPEWTKKLDA